MLLLRVIHSKIMKYIRLFFNRPRFSKTIYLDKDGVLNNVIIRKKKLSSPQNLQEIIINKNLIFLKILANTEKFNLVIISNQPDVSRRIINKRFLLNNINIIRRQIPINIAFLCPHLEEDFCYCRKPYTLMIKNYRKIFSFAVKKEYFIGDTEKDYFCAKEMNIPFIMMKHKYNLSHQNLDCTKINDFSDLSRVI